MNKKIGALIAALCMTNGMAAYALTDEEIDQFVADKIAEGAIDFEGDEADVGEVGDQGKEPGKLPKYVTVDNDDPVGVKGVCEYKWPAKEQYPMPVTVTFVDDDDDDTDDTNIQAWNFGIGGILAPDWSLVELGGPANDTWQMKWMFTTTRPVTSIKLNGFDGFGPEPDSHRWKGDEQIATVFDIRKGGGSELTPGSQNGYPFTYIANAAMVELTATYSHPIFIKGSFPPEYDLYGTLEIVFEEPFVGSVDLEGLMIFRADTDCVLQIEGGLTPTDAGVELQYVGNDGDKGILTIDGEPHERVLGANGIGEDIGAGRYEVKMTLPKGHCYGLEGVDGTTGEWKMVAGPVCN